MKLRSDREGKPFIVLEAGDIAALERVRGLLVCADIYVGPNDRLRLLANEVSDIAMGKLDSINLPSKRARKPEPGGVSAPDGPEASVAIEPPASEPPSVQPDQPPPNLCDRCGEPLVPSELRRSRRVCFSCAPLRESA